MQIPEPETTELELSTFSFLGISTDLNTLRQIKNAHAEQDLEVSCRIHIYLQLPGDGPRYRRYTKVIEISTKVHEKPGTAFFM